MKIAKIFVDCHVFDTGFQGTTTYIKGLYQALIKDTDKEFYLAANDIINLERVFGSHPNIMYLAYKSRNRFTRLLVEIPKMIRKHNIDFAHFQYIVSPFKSCKYIVTTHDVLFIDFPQYFPWFNRVKNTLLYKWSARFADVLFTVSDYSKEQIREHFEIDDVQITCNAVDDSFFEVYNREQVQLKVTEKYGLSNYIIYVSRWEPRKNHDLVLKTFVEEKLYEKYQLLFIGDTTFRNMEYDHYFNELTNDIRQNVTSLSNVAFDDMIMLLRGACASVYPSKAEGFGIPPLESIAAGIPTVSSNATAMSDFDFLEEYLFDPYSQEDFSEKLQKAFKMTTTQIEHLRREIRSKYTWEKAADVYRQAIAAHKK